MGKTESENMKDQKIFWVEAIFLDLSGDSKQIFFMVGLDVISNLDIITSRFCSRDI